LPALSANISAVNQYCPGMFGFAQYSSSIFTVFSSPLMVACINGVIQSLSGISGFAQYFNKISTVCLSYWPVAHINAVLQNLSLESICAHSSNNFFTSVLSHLQLAEINFQSSIPCCFRFLLEFIVKYTTVPIATIRIDPIIMYSHIVCFARR